MNDFHIFEYVHNQVSTPRLIDQLELESPPVNLYV